MLKLTSYEDAINYISDSKGLGIVKPKTGENFGMFWQVDINGTPTNVSVLTVQISPKVYNKDGSVKKASYATIRTMFTPEQYRYHGYSKALTNATIKDLAYNHKEIKVFRTYSNRNSRKIFQDLGFKLNKENKNQVSFGILENK